MRVSGGLDYPSWKYVPNCIDTKDAEKLCMEERMSLVTKDHTILQMKIVANYWTKLISTQMPAGIHGKRKFKSVQTCAGGDNNKIVKTHWPLLKTSYYLKPISEFQPNLAPSIIGWKLPFFLKERATSFIPEGDSFKTVFINFNNF